MQAMQTKYYGPGNVRGSRIIARAAAGSLSVGYDHRLDIEENHRAAAHALAVKLDWLSDAYGTLVSGSLADGSYVHVFTLKDAAPELRAAVLGLLRVPAIAHQEAYGADTDDAERAILAARQAIGEG